MKKKYLLILSVGLFLFAFPVHKVYAQRTLSRPKLVVGIVVDQMRWDFLYRFYDRYKEGGFKRLLKEGFSCENTFINYLPSKTAVGHTVIFTGSVPAITGIVGNDWINQLTGKEWYCTEDHTVQTVGASGDAGEMSPKRLLTSTITDELRLATNFQSRVVGVSLKERAAILPAGHAANAAFWYDKPSGNFITSTYYMEALPEWVKQFNTKRIPQKLLANGWHTLYPIETYKQSSEDNVPWEGKFEGEKAPVFPHKIKDNFANNHGVIRYTPFGNKLTFEFAQATVNGYHLGDGEATDFLTINCASTDYVGHRFGPNSIEIEDTYLRLDKQLADFFRFLDQKVGKGNYLLFLTADHGVSHSIGFMKYHNIPTDFLELHKFEKPLEEILEKKFGEGNLIDNFDNYYVNYHMDDIYDENLDYEAIKKVTVNYLRKQEGIQFAVDMDHIGEASIPEPLKTKLINGYNFKRSGGGGIVLIPGWFEGQEGNTGSTHGTLSADDTHIPLVFMGWGIKHGKTNQHVNMSDIASTLAALLHIQVPNGNVGIPIKGIFE